MAAPNPKFDLEYQYQLFLNRMGLSEAQMPPTQKTQLKQTFFSAACQMLVLLREDVSQLGEKEAVRTLDKMEKQAITFVVNGLNSQN